MAIHLVFCVKYSFQIAVFVRIDPKVRRRKNAYKGNSGGFWEVFGTFCKKLYVFGLLGISRNLWEKLRKMQEIQSRYIKFADLRKALPRGYGKLIQNKLEGFISLEVIYYTVRGKGRNNKVYLAALEVIQEYRKECEEVQALSRELGLG